MTWSSLWGQVSPRSRERRLACLACWSSTPCLACCLCPQTAVWLPATATADGSCWARVRRMRAKEHSFSRSPSSRISICRLARNQRKICSIPKVQRKCLSSLPINLACQFHYTLSSSMSIPKAPEGNGGGKKEGSIKVNLKIKQQPCFQHAAWLNQATPVKTAAAEMLKMCCTQNFI